MSDFETRVLPLVTKWANSVFKDEQLVQDAIGVCWYFYQQTPKALELTAGNFAYVAIRHVRNGRRIPGESDRQQYGKDALDRAYWNGAGMQEVMDKRPGPDKIAEAKEQWELLLRKVTPRQRRFVELAAEEMRTIDMARQLGVTPGRVSHMRRAILAMTKE